MTAAAPPLLTRLPHRRLLSLTGPDAFKFLQGLTTNSLPQLLLTQRSLRNTPHTPAAESAVQFSSLLTAKGRVMAEVLVYATAGTGVAGELGHGEEGVLMEVDGGVVDRVVQHVKRHKLRSKFKFQVLDPEEWQIWHEGYNPGQSERVIPQDLGIGNIDPRAPGFGYRHILSHAHAAEARGRLGDFPRGTPTEYTLHRYTTGIPEGPQEVVPESALPLESNFDLMSGIDFRKGCYVGQELTIRTRHTGVVRKRILPLVFGREGADMSGLEVGSGSDIKGVDNGKKAGTVLGQMQGVGLGLCRLEPMVEKAGEQMFECVRAGGSVKVRAVMPDWHKERHEEEERKRNQRSEIPA